MAVKGIAVFSPASLSVTKQFIIEPNVTPIQQYKGDKEQIHCALVQAYLLS